MIKLENFEVMGWEHAIRGMRNPLNSWAKTDSFTCRELSEDGDCFTGCHSQLSCPLYGTKDACSDIIIGPNDHSLMMKLRNAGTDHRKFMRMIQVYVDITAPLYWWKEFDTYKVGTVANSCSTMHKIHEKEFELADFSWERLTERGIKVLEAVIDELNFNRDLYVSTKDKVYWCQMIQLLPTSYNQKRTVMMNYENLANMYKSRKAHKLDEWRELCTWIEGLPYSELITGEKEDG